MDEKEINGDKRSYQEHKKIGKGWNTGHGNIERKKWRSGYENFVIRYGRKKVG